MQHFCRWQDDNSCINCFEVSQQKWNNTYVLTIREKKNIVNFYFQYKKLIKTQKS